MFLGPVISYPWKFILREESKDENDYYEYMFTEGLLKVENGNQCKYSLITKRLIKLWYKNELEYFAFINTIIKRG